MKKFYIPVLFLTGILLPACENEEKLMFTDFKTGAIPIFAQNSNDSGFIDLVDPDQTVISFSVDKEGLGDVNSVDVTVTYNNSVTMESETEVLTNLTSFPANVQASVADLINIFNPSVVTVGSLNVGDSFIIGGAMLMSDGSYLDGGYSTSVTARKQVALTYNVSCVSNIPLGSYKATSTATSTDGCPPTNPLVDYEYDVTLAAAGVGAYRVSDFFAGVYIDWYGACYGYTFETPGNFSDICNNLTFLFQDAFGANVSGTGTFDPDTGVITYSWENDFGDTGTTTLTPQ